MNDVDAIAVDSTSTLVASFLCSSTQSPTTTVSFGSGTRLEQQQAASNTSRQLIYYS
ncbi:hypothetical protein CY34DRAFT_799608 [Suillus luteus UH-Slu-Lm8-n1]|uniref:Uncharacterized protein n=1 Tax=Suillus luteus UH-Slu-Lm8-n1 TaxID=930992 RepID=A0A0D0BWC7_9AGAM|nr:hypothetical protein CY34DRAFT_799608 [Suillus luteus UH-Slu-Lm8-n1]